jgi:hypothetical protein
MSFFYTLMERTNSCINVDLVTVEVVVILNYPIHWLLILKCFLICSVTIGWFKEFQKRTNCVVNKKDNSVKKSFDQGSLGVLKTKLKIYLPRIYFFSKKFYKLLSGFLGLLWQQNSLNVWQDTTLGNGDTSQKFVQLLVIPDRQLQVPWNDSGLLVVPGSVTSQFENLGGQVLQNSGQVDWGTGSDSFSVVTFSEESMDSTYWELEAGSARSGLGFGFGFSCAFTFSGHFR